MAAKDDYLANLQGQLAVLQANTDPRAASLIQSVKDKIRSANIGTPQFTAPLRQIAALSNTVVLGDSIAAYGLNQTAGGSSSGNGGGNFTNSIIGWANEFMGGDTFDVTSVLALAGATTTDVINNQLPTAVSGSENIGWVHVGINDLNSSIGNLSVETLIANLNTIVSSLAAVKQVVIIDSLNPVLQAGSTGAKTRAYQIKGVNERLSAICARYNNVIFLDLYTTMVPTPENANNDPSSNFLRSDDGIHLVSFGAYTLGWRASRILSPRLRVTKYAAKGTNLLPAWTGTGGTTTPASGTITGTPPVGWNVQLSGGIANQTCTITTLAPDMIRFTCANGAASQMVVFIQITDTSIGAQLSNGDIVQQSFGYQASGLVGMTRLTAYSLINGTQGFYAMGQSAQDPAQVNYPTAAHGGIRQGVPTVITPSTPSTATFIIQIVIPTTSTGAAVVDIYNPQLVKLI